MLPYVAFCLDISTHTSSISSASSSSSPSTDIKTERENVIEQENSTIPNAIDSPEKGIGKGRYGSPDRRKYRTIPLALNEFDRLRNLFPEIPAIFSAQAEISSDLLFEYDNGDKMNEEKLGPNFTTLPHSSFSEERKRKSGFDVSNVTDLQPEKELKKAIGKKNILRIGYSELWLQCLKVLVNLTQNCAVASDILMEEKNNEKRMERSEEQNFRKKDVVKKGNSWKNDGSTEIVGKNKCKSEKDVEKSNIMTVCCSALYFSITRRSSQTVQAHTERACADVTVPSDDPVGNSGLILSGTLSPSETAEEVKLSVKICLCL